MLAAEHLIVRKPGRGSFVADPAVDYIDSVMSPETTSDGTVFNAFNHEEKTIGLIITDFGNSYGTGLIYGMEQASRDNDCFLVLRRTFGVPENEEQSIQKLLSLGVDGLIVFPAQGEFFNAEILKLVIGRFPLVLVDRHLKGVAAASIGTDNIKAALKGTEYLFDLGHTHISFLSPPPADTTALEERVEGFIQAHAERGIAVDKGLWVSDLTSTLPNSFNDENIEHDISRLVSHLQENPTITALLPWNIILPCWLEMRLNALG